MESKLTRLSIAKKGLEEEPTNDNILTHFHNAFLDLLDKENVLTENGYCMLFYSPSKDWEIIKEPDNKSNKPIVRFCLYLTIAYNLNKLYCGLLENIENYPHIQNILPDDVKSKLEEIKERSIKNQEPMFNLLKYYLNKLTDKYAKIYNQEKMRCFVKDVFGNRDTLRMPTKEVDEITQKATPAPV
jgi:hypothetical protein